jgi:hypothetical protein
VQRRLATLRHTLSLRPDRLLPQLLAIADTTDVLDAWLMLTTLEPSLPDDAMDAIRERCRARHGAWIDRMLDARPAASEQDRLEAMIERHENPVHRLLLGLVWSEADPAVVIRFLGHRYPAERASDLVARWIEEMFAWRSLFSLGTDPDRGLLDGFLEEVRAAESTEPSSRLAASRT